MFNPTILLRGEVNYPSLPSIRIKHINNPTKKCLQISFNQKLFFTKIFFIRKFFFCKNLFYIKSLTQIFFNQKFLRPESFWTKIFFNLKYFFKINIYPKLFCDTNFFTNIFLWYKFFWPKFYKLRAQVSPKGPESPLCLTCFSEVSRVLQVLGHFSYTSFFFIRK